MGPLPGQANVHVMQADQSESSLGILLELLKKLSLSLFLLASEVVKRILEAIPITSAIIKPHLGTQS